jgi:hypothetical protein
MLDIDHPSDESLITFSTNLNKEGFGPIWVLEIGLT